MLATLNLVRISVGGGMNPELLKRFVSIASKPVQFGNSRAEVVLALLESTQVPTLTSFALSLSPSPTAALSLFLAAAECQQTDR